MKTDKGAVKTLEKKYLPKELDGKSEAEIEAYVVTKTKEREAYQDKINTLAKHRQAYIDKKTAENTAAQQDDLGTAINNSIMKLANKKGYTVDKN
ncbi:hypothetical protein D3C80_1620030 [compost metagenome]